MTTMHNKLRFVLSVCLALFMSVAVRAQQNTDTAAVPDSVAAMLGMRYSLLADGRLRQLADSADAYMSRPGYADFCRRIEHAVAVCKLYRAACDALGSPFDEERVVDIRMHIIPMLETKTDNAGKGLFAFSPEQFAEIDSLDIRLSRYKDGMRALHGIVGRVNANADVVRMRSERTAEAVAAGRRAMERILVPSADNGLQHTIDRYFSLIPYLGQLFAEYKDELKADAFAETAVEKAIHQRGVEALREFARKFARERNRGLTTVADCRDAVDLILETDNLKARIDTEVMGVAFLKAQYEAYRKAILKNFKTVTSAESEILGE